MKYADELRLINDFRESAPVNVRGLASALGLEVHDAYLDDEISGMIERSGDTYKITVNTVHPSTRQRFTIAHELGHYMMHRGLIGDGVDDDRAYRSTHDGKYHNTAIGPKEETEANKFAASLLMPMNLIEMLRVEGFKTPASLAHHLDVSEHAMRIRVGAI